MRNRYEVPSTISYSTPSEDMEEQWGSDLSPDAVAMIHTKMELDVGDVSTELDFILQTLYGTKDLRSPHFTGTSGLPDYTDRSSEQIVMDYLKKIVEKVLENLLEFRASKELLDGIPTDIVITVPAVPDSAYCSLDYFILTIPPGLVL